MRYLLIALILLSSCADRTIDQQAKNGIEQMSSSNADGLRLLDAYQKTTTGGMERIDGKHTSTSYTMVLIKGEQVRIDEVYLYGEKKDFEAIDYEGKFYIIVQVYPEAKEQLKGDLIQTSNAADIFYVEKGVNQILTVPKFFVKEAVIGN